MSSTLVVYSLLLLKVLANLSMDANSVIKIRLLLEEQSNLRQHCLLQRLLEEPENDIQQPILYTFMLS